MSLVLGREGEVADLPRGYEPALGTPQAFAKRFAPLILPMRSATYPPDSIPSQIPAEIQGWSLPTHAVSVFSREAHAISLMPSIRLALGYHSQLRVQYICDAEERFGGPVFIPQLE